jgi:hypothetical protein
VTTTSTQMADLQLDIFTHCAPLAVITPAEPLSVQVASAPEGVSARRLA